MKNLNLLCWGALALGLSAQAVAKDYFCSRKRGKPELELGLMDQKLSVAFLDKDGEKQASGTAKFDKTSDKITYYKPDDQSSITDGDTYWWKSATTKAAGSALSLQLNFEDDSNKKFSKLYTCHAKTGGHQLKTLASMSNPALEKYREVAAKANEENKESSALSAYKVKTFSPPRAPGETETELWKRVVGFSMHRDYPITGDEGHYNWARLDAHGNPAGVGTIYSGTVFEDNNELVEATREALAAGLIVLFGSGNGNNTSANFVAIVDSATNEFVYLIDSNFGSDD